MSPTEHDLRAALRDGEGDGPSPDRLIALGRAQHARRRMQVLTTAAAVVVVAGAGTGIVTLGRSGGGHKNADSAAGQSTSGQSDQRFSNTGAAAGGGSGALAPPAAAGSTNAEKAADAAIGCPATLPRYALPGGGSPGQFGANGPLFSKPVQSLIVCSYSAVRTSNSGALSAPGRVTLSGARATRLAASLDDAAPKPSASCPSTAGLAAAPELAIIGVAADGTTVGTVTVTRSANACAGQVTNGTAVRFNWTPPSDLLPVLSTLTPKPKVHGSPISS